MNRIRVSLLSLMIVLLAVPGFGQTVTSDCREFLGGIRCESSLAPQIQIPDFVGHNVQRQMQMESLRRSLETRALIDQMRSQTQLNNALAHRLAAPPPRVLETQKSLTTEDILALYDGRATVQTSPEAERAAQRIRSGQTTLGQEAQAIVNQWQKNQDSQPPTAEAAPAQKVMDLPEILDYARGLLVRHKAGELSAEMLKGLVNVRMNAWLRSLPSQGLSPIEIDKLTVMAKGELAPIKKELK